LAGLSLEAAKLAAKHANRTPARWLHRQMRRARRTAEHPASYRWRQSPWRSTAPVIHSAAYRLEPSLGAFPTSTISRLVRGGYLGSNDVLKRDKGAMIARYARSSDLTGALQVLVTLIPFGVLWWATIRCAASSPWLALIPLSLIILFIVRV